MLSTFHYSDLNSYQINQIHEIANKYNISISSFEDDIICFLNLLSTKNQSPIVNVIDATEKEKEESYEQGRINGFDAGYDQGWEEAKLSENLITQEELKEQIKLTYIEAYKLGAAWQPPTKYKKELEGF